MEGVMPAGYVTGVDGDPVEMERWCPRCRERTVPLDRDPEKCAWCDGRTVPLAEVR